MHGSMQKLQILFPEPVLTKLRKIASLSDRPVSELVRRAVDDFIKKHPQAALPSPRLPTFKGGKIQVRSDEMKQIIYEDRVRI